MLNLLTAFFLLIFLSACGVDTSSSNLGLNKASVKTTDTDTTDDNITTPDDNITTPVDDVNITIDSEFDTVGAVFDANGCNANTYRIARDASYNGDNLGENGAGFYVVEGQGLEIRSEHAEGDPEYASKAWVTLYYKRFPDAKHLGIQDYTSYLMYGVFFFTYDIAWSDESILDIDNTVYVRSEKYEKPTCYRLILNSVSGTEIDVQKVYR